MIKNLSDVVTVSRRFTRSVRVDTDIGDPTALQGYICPQSAIDTLYAMARHREATSHSAFTWTGPYGSGKSSLAVALAAMLQGEPDTFNKALYSQSAQKEVDELKAHFRSDIRPWHVCPIAGLRADAESIIGEALRSSMTSLPLRSKDESFANWVGRIAAEIKGPGLAIIIDEMGKFLENSALDQGDIHVFQDLAEISSRSGGRLIIVGILHQAFDEYAQRLSREGRDEWLKIQGRYLDLPINLASDEQIELISRAIESSEIKADADVAASIIASAMRGAGTSDSQRLAQKLVNCWPLHPLTAALLGPISRRRFGQSQRSIFGFLTSAEPFGFQDYLTTTGIGAPRFGADKLWDYLRANLESAILASPDGHRWSTAVDAIERCENRGGTGFHLAAIKSIALLDLFKDRSGLQPTPEIVMHGIGLEPGKKWQKIVDDLINWSVVVLRKHSGTFAIYAGSDFDIEKALDDAQARGIGTDFKSLEDQPALRPVLAKRHYEETGALRWFEVGISPLHEAEERVKNYIPAPGSAGLFLILVSANQEIKSVAKRIARSAATLAKDHLVMVGWTRDSFRLRELTSDLAALEHVRGNYPALEGDAVARREIDARLTRLSADLDDRLRDAIDQVDWYGPSEELAQYPVQSIGPAGLTVLASRLADLRFPNTPKLHNELINRTKPSSNAAGATRLLLHAMVEKHSEERLGFQGYPAEAGLFYSLLVGTGLYGDAGSGEFGFIPPLRGDKHCLYPMWEAADNALENSEVGLSIADIFDLWRKPPYGVRDGLLPVLALAYILGRASCTSLYLDGVFRPQLDTYLVDRLLQDPSVIKIRDVELTSKHVELVSELAKVLQNGHSIDPTALELAKLIVGRVRALPNWTQRTGMLTQRAMTLRLLGLKSHDPNKLVFEDIPDLFGEDPKLAAENAAAALNELETAYNKMLGDLALTLLRELRCHEALDDDHHKLHDRCETVRGLSGNFRLDALATRLGSFGGDIEEIEGIASLAANKPARDWVDRDIDAAKIELAALAQQFLRAEGLAHLKGRGDRRTSIAVYISDPNFPSPISPSVELTNEECERADLLAASINELIRQSKASPSIAFGAIARLGLSIGSNLELTEEAI